MGLHKIPYTRETWHAKLKNTFAGLAQSKDKQPQHFCILSLVPLCRGQALTSGLLPLSSSLGTTWVKNVLCHFYHLFYHKWLTNTSSITLSRYAVITTPEILLSPKKCVQPQYFSECHQNTRLYEWRNVNPSSLDSLHGSSFDLLIHSGQRPFYLLTAIQPPFLFSHDICFLSKPGEVLTTEKEISFWFNFWMSFTLIGQLR